MVYLSLGTNLGDRRANLSNAIEHLNGAGITVIRASSLYETSPRDVPDQPWFLNMVVQCETRYFPQQLLTKIFQIERAMGRNRGPSAVRRGPRLIDIDILLYKNAVIQTARLTVPHPRMLDRRFVLEPLLELAPQLQHPVSHRPISASLIEVKDQPVAKLTT